MHAQLTSLGKQRIVNIGDISNTTNFVTHIDEATLQHVISHKGGGMSDMSRVIGSDSTRVHRDTRSWFERHNGLTSGIKQTDWHLTSPFLFLFRD